MNLLLHMRGRMITTGKQPSPRLGRRIFTLVTCTMLTRL